MNICLIPARSGSKRIKNKNIINFFGLPLIAYSIKNALKSNLFDEIIVSTDSKKIAKIANKYGALTPFIRPKKYSTDKVIDKDVIKHFLKIYKKKIDFLCYLYPATPLLKTETLKNSYKKIVKTNYHNLFTVCKYSSDLNRVIIKNSKNEIKFKKITKQNKSSKNLKDLYYDAGQCYWYNFKKNCINRTLGFEISRTEGIDINTIQDINLVKLLYKSIKS